MPMGDKIVALPTTDPRRALKKQGIIAGACTYVESGVCCIDVDVCSLNYCYCNLLGSGGLLSSTGRILRQTKK
jgi:hypothetical protein